VGWSLRHVKNAHTLSLEQIHEIADRAEEEAWHLPRGPNREHLFIKAFQLRREANMALWLGQDELRAEVRERDVKANIW
jgi:hypothetical protein